MRTIAMKLLLVLIFFRYLGVVIRAVYLNTPLGEIWLYPYPLIFSFLTIVVVKTLISDPLVRIDQAMSRFRSGDFDERIDFKRNDEIGNIARTFNQLADRVQSLILSERRMTVNLAHEIRQPLARMALLIDLLPKIQDENEVLDSLKIEVEELSCIASSLLRLSQYERKEFELTTEVFSLESLLKDITMKVKPLATKKNCQLIVSCHGDLHIKSDRPLLRIAITNILENSIRYTAQETNIHLDAIITTNGDWIEIKIRDFGMGVPEQDLDRIFMPFERIDPSRDKESGGVGLGLSITKSIVRCLKGEVYAKLCVPGMELTIRIPN